MLNTTIINPEEATKLDSMLQDLVNAMQESGDDATVHCPVFELFQTTIGIGNNPHIETDILGIKCQVSKATLLREFVLQTSQTLEQQGKGKFIPAGLANVIGTETMTSIICSNNQYLKSITTVPINGLPADALKIKITIADNTPEKDKVPITVHDYLLNAEWCHGLESTEHEGRYLLITTHSQIAEAQEWLDENLESLFVDYLPNYGNFNPIEGHAFPTQGDKPRFIHLPIGNVRWPTLETIHLWQLWGKYSHETMEPLPHSSSSHQMVIQFQWERIPCTNQDPNP